MVVTRRAPALPTPTSRTNSAQAIPRVKGKVPHATPDVSSPLANGTPGEGSSNDLDPAQADDDAGILSKKGKGKGKSRSRKEKAKRTRGRTSFVELLTRILLLWFTIYTLSVCPSDDALKSPICRGLHAYRQLILEPYVLPTVQRALAHPLLAPYVERATPIIYTSIDTARPVVLRVHSEWNRRVVPQWRKRVVPQWQKHVTPQLNKHIWPHAAHAWNQVAPYVTAVQAEYDSKLAPSIRFATQRLYRWQHQARPYVVLAAHKTYDGYQMAKPYAVPVLQRAQLLSIQLTRYLGEQRRQFVDPHVQKIWERVKELSSGEHKITADTAKSFAGTLSEASASAASSAIQGVPVVVPAASDAVLGSASAILPDTISEAETSPTVIPSTNPVVSSAAYVPAESPVSSVRIAPPVTSSSEAVTSAAFISTEELVSAASSLSSATSSEVPDNTADAASIIRDTIAPSASSLPAEFSASIAHASGTASTTTLQASASIGNVVAEASSSFGSVTDQVTNTVTSAASTTSPTRSPDEADLDDDLELESYYAKLLDELGLHNLEDVLNDTPPSEQPPVDPVADQASEEAAAEERRKRKEQTAQKRADITVRHSKWEAALEDRIASARKELRKSLVESRKAAAADLKESEVIHKEVEDLVEEAEKYLKGAEKFMKNLRRESRTDEEKRNIWERVVEKVDKKFEERLSQTESVVNGWYMGVIDNELTEIRRLAAEIKDIADRAQADIGLDYAWLDDVTVGDWQRYHDLERRVDNFTVLASSIQDGSHPSPPINPVLPALEDLQNEVQDVVVGFEMRLRRIKRNGERAFGAAPDGSDAGDVPSDETVSILPIEADGDRVSVGESPSVPPVVIGRSKEEILSALNRVAEQEAQVTPIPGDKHMDPQEVVAHLAQEAVDETNLSPPSESRHEEL